MYVWMCMCVCGGENKNERQGKCNVANSVNWVQFVIEATDVHWELSQVKSVWFSVFSQNVSSLVCHRSQCSGTMFSNFT